MPSPAAGITAFVTLTCVTCATRRRYPSARGALVADVGRIVATRSAVEPELLAPHQPAQVRQVARRPRAARAPRSPTSPRVVTGERDRDRERDHDHDRRDRRLVRERARARPTARASPSVSSGKITSSTPRAGGDAAPTLELPGHREHVPEDGGDAEDVARRGGRRRARPDPGGERALGDVEREHERAGLPPEEPERVRRAGVARSPAAVTSTPRRRATSAALGNVPSR